MTSGQPGGDAEALRRDMVDGLAERGELDERWRAAFLAVPRHAFIPALVWRQDPGADGDCDLIPLRRAEIGEDAWLRMAYANDAVATQVDDGHPAGDDLAGLEITSSASMPAIVAQMLAALGAEPGMTVLEIGTGTGYHAALLAHRLGAGNVTSVEIDQAVAEHARRALTDTGYGGLAVITADGAHGHPARAPYDRVISTAAVEQVPYPWVAQTRPGGRVLTPWATAYYPSGLLTLTVHADGTATGCLGDPASFMRLRAQRLPRTGGGLVASCDAVASHTEIHPYRVAGDRHAATAIGLRVPHCRHVYTATHAEHGTLWLLDHGTNSWATLDLATTPPYQVRQAGGRRLWDEVAAAYHWWVDVGRPTVDRWRFVVSPEGQHIDLARVECSADPA